MIRSLRNRRDARVQARRKREHRAEVAELVVELRDVSVSWLNASDEPQVMVHLLDAIDGLEAALRVLRPDAPPPELFAIPT